MNSNSTLNNDVRSEKEIFSDLELLCTSPGYAHAIAYFSFRDNTIKYEDTVSADDVLELSSRNNLVRNEISTLIGLMCKISLNINMPTSATLQEYIDKTELLLKELHESMMCSFTFKPLIEDNNDNFFKNGMSLREAIYYGGESAYDFQYKDLSLKKYSKDNDWFKENKGYSIEQASAVISAISKIQNNKLNTLHDDFKQLHPDDWTFLPKFMFTIDEISKEACLDRSVTKAVINSFVADKEMNNKDFCAVDDFNIINAYPIIAMDDDNYILFQCYNLVTAFYETPFFWFNDDSSYKNIAMKHRGDFTEEFTTERLKLVFGEKNVFQNIEILDSKKQKAGEIDILVIFSNRAIIVQAKSKKLTIAARKGNLSIIQGDFKKAVQQAYNQANECALLLCNSNYSLVREDGSRLEIQRNYKEIYPVCIVSDHYPTLSIQARQFLKYTETEQLMPPFVIDVFFLDVMTEMLQSPLYFLSYLNRRAKFKGKVISMHELAIFSYHLIRNLWIDDEHSMVQIDEGCSADLDIAMAVRRAGASGDATPKGILTKFHDTFWHKIIHDIKKIEDPWAIELGFLFLTFSEELIKTINNYIDEFAQLAKKDFYPHDLTIPMKGGLPGLTIHCNRGNVYVAQKALASHCAARKYVCKSQRWVGVCINPDNFDIRFGLFLDHEWEQDDKMDILTKEMSATPPVKIQTPPNAIKRVKIGRNQKCPCGSGKKYKKCCLNK